MWENLEVPAYSLRRKCLMTEKKLRLTKDGQHQSRSAVSSKWPTSSVGFPKQSTVCTAVLVSALLASVPSVRPSGHRAVLQSVATNGTAVTTAVLR